MRLADLPLNPTPRMLRQFAGAGLVLLVGLGLWETRRRGWVAGPITLIAVGCVLGAVGLLRPRWLKPVFVAATLVTLPIGWVLSQAILAVMYFGVITPVGLFFRMTGRDALGLRRAVEPGSYWAAKPAPEDVRRYLRQY
jgi:hypothetical protein